MIKRGEILLILILNLTIVQGQVQNMGSDGKNDTFLRKSEASEMKSPEFNAPGWVKDAVIVEIPVRGFNIPDYKHPEKWKSLYGDGTYLSVCEKLDFLRQFDVNVICLYSVYWNTPVTNLYAIRHDQADPSLGTLEDIKTLINVAHQKGFHIISNTNHYGVDPSSPMIREHPDWFLPEKDQFFEQRLFDLNNPEVLNYLIDTHAWWCTEVGLDGWRIDVGHETYRKYIWDKVLSKCYRAGKQILLAPEGVHLEGHIRGAGWAYYPPTTDMENPASNWDNHVPEFGSMKSFSVFTRDDPYNTRDISSHNSRTTYAYNCDTGKYERTGAYNIKGSRYLFGYNLLFAPFVPWMMAGELFNATHLSVPALLHNEYNGKLLHSYVDWDDLKSQQEVIRDFVKIADIRKSNLDIFHNNRYETNLIDIPCHSEPYVDVIPYARYISGKKAIIVIGNSSVDSDVVFELNIPLEKLGLSGSNEYNVKDLWNGTEITCNQKQLSHLHVKVPRDKSPGGGVRVLLICPGDRK